MRPVRARFWIESTLGVLSAVLMVITLIWQNWIERVFHVDPDAGNGALEWLIVATLASAAIVASGLARSEWRRARSAA